VSDHHEVERAYALGPDDALPDLSALPGVATVTEPDTATLVATYLDTADLALVRAGVTLRRRAGGHDAGWHLKVPAGDGRDEVHRPLGRTEAVPAVLLRQVLGWTRGRDLRPVADIETTRTTRLLLDDDGTVLAEVCDDRVRGRAVGAAEPVVWREVEVELATAGPGLLEATDVVLAEHGIHPRTEQRKVGSVLAHRLTDRPRPGPDDAAASAGEVLHGRLGEQVDALLRADCDVRRGVPDGVHQLRVACRRLRAALATFRPVVDRAVTDPVRAELRWLARTLGDGRDAEVVQERLREHVAELPREQVLGPVRRRLGRTYADRRRQGDTHAAEVLASRRYLRLLARLDRLTASPPRTEVAAQPAGAVLRRRVRKDVKRLRGLVETAEVTRAAGGAAHAEALHDVRKAAKRLRYACEVLEPGWGKPARRLRKAAQEVTRVLGDGQDAAVAADDLRRIAKDATGDGENAFTYGVLHAREQARAESAEAEFLEVWDVVRHKRVRAWLSD
jgi:CHAD domain-containing protein